jgi:hypothetical protein
VTDDDNDQDSEGIAKAIYYFVNWLTEVTKIIKNAIEDQIIDEGNNED